MFEKYNRVQSNKRYKEILSIIRDDIRRDGITELRVLKLDDYVINRLCNAGFVVELLEKDTYKITGWA